MGISFRIRNQHRAWLLLTLILLLACNHKTNDLKQNPPSKIVENEKINALWLEFAPWQNERYCDSTALVETDCDYGYLHFSPGGKVMYIVQCVDDVDQEICLGTFTAEKDKYQLTLTEFYSYHLGELEDQHLADPESGRFAKMKKPYHLTIQKMKCKGIWGFNLGTSKEPYPFSASELEEAPDVFSSIKKLRDWMK